LEDKKMRESLIEKKLKKTIEDYGGKCLKFVSPGMRGVPDRICLFPSGKVAFIETKAAGGVISPLQRKRMAELTDSGFYVAVIDHPDQIFMIIHDMLHQGVISR
jgi:ribosomal protein S6